MPIINWFWFYLKIRILYLIYSFISNFFVCWIYKEQNLYFFIKSIYFKVNWISIDLSEVFLAELKSCAIVSFSIVLITHLFLNFVPFILNGLYKIELKQWYQRLSWFVLAFIVALYGSYTWLLPNFTNFFYICSTDISYIQPQIRIGTYYSICSRLMVYWVLLFQLICLFKFVPEKILEQWYKLRGFVFVILTCILISMTPPELSTILLLFCPIIGLIEFFYFSFLLKKELFYI